MTKGLLKLIPPKFRYGLSKYKRWFIGYKKYSQYGEDEELATLFKNVHGGFYVDVGAHHPQRYSNTHLLFKKGWSGLNIDPDPAAIVLFNKARPNDTNVEIGIGREKTTLSYFQFSDPALNTFKEKEAKRWMDKDWVEFIGTRSVPVAPLRDILHAYAPGKHINVLTVDAEGMGLEVLQSNDWEAWLPDVIVVEDDVRAFLEEKGYVYHKECGISHIFIHAEIENRLL